MASRTALQPVIVVGASARLADEVQAALAPWGYACVVAHPDAALEAASRGPVLAVLLEMSGAGDIAARFEVVRPIARRLPVVLLANPGSESLAIEAVRCRVVDYVRVPFEPLQLRDRVELLLAADPPPRARDSASVEHRIAGTSAAVLRLHEFISRVAPTDANVLITGETGTGKELVAESIHAASRRRHHRLVSIDCPAVPDTLFESELFGHERGAFTGADAHADGRLQQAHRGTVFFDEVADLSLAGQAKLLRTLESNEISRLGGRTSIRVDLRVLSATNQDLPQLVADGRFRRDLYYRLKVCHVHLPPLRDRASDIPLLLDLYLRRFAGKRVPAFADDALRALAAYPWPGNLRELRNLVEGVLPFVRGDRVELDDLPEVIRRYGAGSASPDERARIVAALRVTHWNKRQAARQLRWSRMTLYRKLAKYGIGIRDTTAGDSPVFRDMSHSPVTPLRR